MINAILDKEKFSKRAATVIANRKTLLDFYHNAFLPLLRDKFDGRVYNKRFANAVREKAKEISQLVTITDLENDTMELRIRNDQYNYTDFETLFVRVITNNEFRLSYDATITDDLGKRWLQNFNETTDEYQTAIDNFDQFYEVAEELDNAVEKYKQLPFIFRKNIQTASLTIFL